MVIVKRHENYTFVLALYLRSRMFTIYEHLFGISRVYKERFHSRGQHLCLFIERKERKEFNSQRIFLDQHGHRCVE